ncbi:MAG: hypothetical protein WA857_21925 [Candidatus Acidiferrum sp.]|jgi:hypothetical protein
MAKAPDDLEAVRVVTTALSGFGPEEQERILRWAREKLGLSPLQRNLPESRVSHQATTVLPAGLIDHPAAPQVPTSGKDLKSFVTGKNPKSDIQFAATVAYFYRFESLPEQRKNEIDAAILQDACRLAGRERFKNPRVTLNNAKNLGLLDSGSEAGKFTINTVGENLVAMTLPGQADGVSKKKSKKLKKTPKTAIAKRK